MSKPTDEQKLVRLMRSWGIGFVIIDKPNFMATAAIKRGAVKCYVMRNEVDFYFNSKGQFLGTSTNSIDSWKPRRTKSRGGKA